MAVENEVEHRHRQERALQTMINEKKAELDRYERYHIDRCLLTVFSFIIQIQHAIAITRENRCRTKSFLGAYSK